MSIAYARPTFEPSYGYELRHVIIKQWLVRRREATVGHLDDRGDGHGAGGER
jgi:hypothetical protein